MKLRINYWLGCGLAALALMGVTASASNVNARRVRRPVYRVARARRQRPAQAGASVKRITSIPDQGYTNYVTGNHALYTLPGTVHGARRLLTRSEVKQLSNRQIRFMTYQKAVTNRDSTYYKIVSLHHSVRGWIYQTDLRSILNRKQQAADLLVGPQIDHAEMMADESKHDSLVDRSSVSLKSARKELRAATKSARALKGTPNYGDATQDIHKAYQYLRQVKAATPSEQTLSGLSTIRSEYQQAAKSVAAAQTASADHQNGEAKQDIKAANQSLRHVSKILNQIHNRHDQKAAEALFDQAVKYVDTNYSFNPMIDFNSHDLNTHRLSNRKLIRLIKSDEKSAQMSIMNLYPNLGDFDATLTDAYRAQSALNRAQDLVASLKGDHVQKAELDDIQVDQHNINALWNV